MKQHYLELILYKAYAELRVEAARSYLGVMWWILEPILYMSAFYVVFGLVFQRGGEGFVAFLLCGLVVWKWFGSTVQSGANAIAANMSLMQQVYLPKFIFPCVVLLTNTAKFLIILALLLLFLVIDGHPPTAAWLALPVLISIQFLLIAAVSGLAAALVPLVPDLKLLINNGLMLLFFVSGIFFDISNVPDNLQRYFSLNPVAELIASYRTVLLEGLWPDWVGLSAIVIGSLLVIWLTKRLLTRLDRLYPKMVT